MPEGKEIGKAYVTVNLNDETDGDYEKIKAKLAAQADVKISTKLDGPSAADYEKIKAEAKTKSVEIPAHVDNSQVKQAFKDITDTIDTDSKQSSSAVSGMLAATAAGWTALGSLLAGPAVSLALGVVAGGFAAIGIAAEHSSPQVTQAFNTMKTQGADVLKASFQSLTPVIVGALNQWSGEAVKLGPAFAQISTEIAPGLAVINNALLQAANVAMPAFVSSLGQATPMAQALGGAIVNVAGGFAQFLTHLDFSQADAGLSSLGRDLGQLESGLAIVLNAVLPLGNALLSSVVPAVLSLVTSLASGLAPALQAVGSGIQALAPLLNFMAGPTAAVLIGVAAFKTLGAATNALLPVFNTVSSAVTNYGNKIVSMVGGSENAIGSFTVLTDAAKKQAIQAAASALATAQQTAATATNALTTLEASAAADASSVSQEQLAVARTAATAATEAETEATAVLTVASEASSFALAPLGIVLGVAAGAMALFGSSENTASQATAAHTSRVNELAAALKQSSGAIDANVRSTAAGQLADFSAGDGKRNLLEDVRKLVGPEGIPQLTDAYLGNGTALDTLKKKLQDNIAAHTEATGAATAYGEIQTNNIGTVDAEGQANQQLLDILNNETGTFGQAIQQRKDAAAAEQGATAAVQLTGAQMDAASSVAQMFGMNINDVAAAFRTLPGAGSAGADAVNQVSSAFTDGEVKMLNAEQGIKDYFTKLQQNATQANQAVANANHSYQQSITAVADAQHSYAQSQQAVVTANEGVVKAEQQVAQAQQGVISAEHSLANAQYSEAQAQDALTQARKDAVEQLKSLQLQLNDQVAAEQRAKLTLFQQTQTSAALGVTPLNAESILAEPTTKANLAQQQAALDLINAQNQVADSLDSLAKQQDKVNVANAQGVNGNPAVVSAAHALSNAQDQVAASVDAVGKAQQAVRDAQAGVVAAQRAVSDAVYNETKARQAVKDAIYSEQQALQAVRTAQQNATQANMDNTRSLDLNTQAGRNNWAQLNTLFQSYPGWLTPIEKYNQMVNDTATAFNMSKQAAFDYLQQQGKIPANFTFTTTGVATADFTQLNRVYQDKFGGHIGAISLNSAHAFAEGGHVRGPGGPKSDDINAKLSDNEYVQPADAVDHYGVGFMEAVRQKKLPKGGDGAALPGFAAGGLYQTGQLDYVLSGTGSGYQTAVDTLNLMGFPAPPGLPAYVPPAPVSFTGGAVSGAAGTNEQIVQQVFQQMFGWGTGPEWAATQYVEMRESGFNNTAQNPTSTAYGMFQFLDSTWAGYGIPKTSDPTQQAIAGARYIKARYGDPIGAANHERAYNWYDNGGYMLDKPGINTTGKPEMVLPNGLTQTLEAINAAFQSDPSSGGRAGVSVTNHIATVAMDPHEVAQVASRELAWALRNR